MNTSLMIMIRYLKYTYRYHRIYFRAISEESTEKHIEAIKDTLHRDYAASQHFNALNTICWFMYGVNYYE